MTHDTQLHLNNNKYTLTQVHKHATGNHWHGNTQYHVTAGNAWHNKITHRTKITLTKIVLRGKIRLRT